MALQVSRLYVCGRHILFLTTTVPWRFAKICHCQLASRRGWFSYPTSTCIICFVCTVMPLASASRVSSIPFSIPEATHASLTRLLAASVTPVPTASCSSTTAVVVQLATALVIPDYSEFYSGSIDSFQPTWSSLDDGSMITPAYTYQLSKSFTQLMMAGALALLFTRNTIASAEYILFSKIKTKNLLHVLFLSQILGLISSAVSISTYFHNSMDCVAYVTSRVFPRPSLNLSIKQINNSSYFNNDHL